MPSSTEIVPKKYPRRPGTSGVLGQWYETKLLSLIYFRAIHSDKIEKFYLATNIDEVDSFDDICFWAKLREINKPIAVFLQAKHKEDSNSVFKLSKKDLAKYFNSYLKIRLKFELDNTEDVLFSGKLNETDCLFVIYTNAKGDETNETYEGSLADDLNALIRTGDPGSQPSHRTNVEHLCEIVIKEQMIALARQMAKCIFGEFNDIQMLMQQEVVQHYHVILGQKAFDISQIQPEGHRVATFRNDFFDINEEFLRLFKDELCTEILKRRRRHNPNFQNVLNSLVLLGEFTDTETLYKEVGSCFTYKNGEFVSLDKNPPSVYKLFLQKINETQVNIRKIVQIAVEECLRTLKVGDGKQKELEFKVPASFGNKDLTISREDVDKIERKLDDLSLNIECFINKSEPSNVILIDNSFGEGFLELNGGIASAVGNLLVLDESSDSKKQLMKITDNYEFLGNLSKKLYCKLKAKFDNLDEYKFKVKAKIFPKLLFATDEYHENVVRDFFDSLIFYTSQQNEDDVEKTLISEITNSHDVEEFEVNSGSIFLKYHDAVEKWSMTTEVKKGTYLDKEGTLYKNAVNAARQQLTSVRNWVQRIKNVNYTFREEAVSQINFDGLPTVIVTDNSALTVAKLIKHLPNTVVLDFDYILNLSERGHKALGEELMNTKKAIKLIVVFMNAQSINTSSFGKLEKMANSIKDKNVIIITDQDSVENAKKYFSPTGNVIKDKIKLIDFSEESQKRILENTKLIFQGDEVSLEQILGKDAMGFVEGNVLNKMMHSNKNIIGKPVSDSNYKPNLYIPRRVKPFFKKTENQSSSQTPGIQEHVDQKQIQTLDAPGDDAVIIFGDPGMGKSTLLTHLSLTTKKNWTEMGWIVRINLLEHTTQFSKWKDNKTTIDTLESLKFLCQAALSEESGKTKDLNIALEQSVDGTVHLTGCNGNEWTVFELKMFLNFYSYRQIKVLFDGFDEICPTYMNEVLALINSVKKFPRTHKMWITSRLYEKIYTTLENLKLGILCRIEPLDVYEQGVYLTTLWDKKEILKDLKDNHYKNICDCVSSVVISYGSYILLSKKAGSTAFKKDMPFCFVGFSLIKYLKMNLKSAPSSVMDILEEEFRSEVFKGYCKEPTEIFEVEHVATPLHLEIMADYFYNKIKEINVKRNDTEWYWDYDIFDVYKYYLETKLSIRLEDKAQNDMSKPENQSAYKREYKDCLEKHKKLAVYGLYYRSRSKLFNECELKQIRAIINELKEGEERTGIICNVVNDMPLFVHSTFEEYLAVEYICDLIKTQENPQKLWDFILNVVFFGNINVLAALDAKLGGDPLDGAVIKNYIDPDLLPLFRKNKEIIFQLLLKQGKNKITKRGEIESALTEAFRYNLRNLIYFFAFPTLNGTLNQSNLMDFIEIVKETNMLLRAITIEFEPVVSSVVNHVKRIDISKLNLLFENIELVENFAELSIDEILHKLHGYLWTRMDIVPDFNNSIFSELRTQIHFI